MKTTWASITPQQNHRLISSMQSVSHFLYRFIHSGSRGQSMGGRRRIPWTGRQSIAGPHTNNHEHTLVHTPKGNLERPVNLTGMSLDCGKKPEYPRMHRENMQTP
ncbi:hypothetical protein GOODEAATRI_013060 [Goodea atripinnis]|uniref:Uncharacterized protein n=1 Tax=Goodea atripinnis TaxID=208336 RepID=A0ABV0NU73_9TELE